MIARVPALDGLRGLAIGLVLWLHLAMAGFWGLAYPPSLGRLGVSLFFVLSGYLITTIYLRGDPKISRFWIRRALRIFPAFYVYLAAVGALWAFGLYNLTPVAFGAAATYTMNLYKGSRGWPLEHTWSLAIEEQFYLVWPPVLCWLGPRRALVLLVGLLSAWPLQRFARTGHFGHPSANDALFAATFDGILWGCVMALGAYLWPQRRLSGGAAAGALLCILVTVVAPDRLPVALLPILRNAALATIVGWAARTQPDTGVAQLLGNPFLGWLGTRSYSLYLWHLLFCDPRWLAFAGGHAAPLVAGVVAELSYRTVERPVLAWRDRQMSR